MTGLQDPGLNLTMPKEGAVKLIDKLTPLIESGTTFFSFEYFPPKTDDGVQKLQERQHRMQALGPAFCDITWGAGGSTADLTMDIASAMQNKVGGAVVVRGGVVSAPRMWGVAPVARLSAGTLPAAPAAGGDGDDDAPDVHQHAGGESPGGAAEGQE